VRSDAGIALRIQLESFVDALNANQIMFIASRIQDWLKAQEIKMLYIKPGSPWEDGHIGRAFTTSFAMNLLTANSSEILHEARVILESWHVEYNERRPHSSLSGHNEYACRRTNRLDGAARPQTLRRSPRNAFGWNSGQRHKVAHKRKTKKEPAELQP
jgi:transposase InsO family protein